MPPGRALDLTEPIDWGHPLNRTRAGSLLGAWYADQRLPGWGGVRLRDAVRSGAKVYDGTLTSLGSVPWVGGGRPGGNGAIDFNDNGHVNLGSGSGSALTGGLAAVTLTAWARVRSFQGSFPNIRVIAGLQDSAGSQSTAFLRLGDAGDQTHFQAVVSTGSEGKATGATAASLATWYHLALVYDGANVYLYLNGRQDGSTAKTGAIQATTAPFVIGSAVAGTGDRPFDGQIDEVEVRDWAMSASEVWSHYDESARGNPARWRWYTPRAWAFGGTASSPPPPSTSPFRPAPLDGLGSAGPHFANPLGG